MCLTEVSGGGFWRGSLEEVSGGGLWRGYLERKGLLGHLWWGSLEGDAFCILFDTRFPLGLFAIKRNKHVCITFNNFSKDYLVANKTQKDSSWD